MVSRWKYGRVTYGVRSGIALDRLARNHCSLPLALGKGADILVEEAVALSLRHGISKVIIGATIVSLGTTLPEVTVSVMSAIKGNQIWHWVTQ